MTIYRTGKTCVARLGRTYDNLRFTRAVYSDSDGRELVRHKAFANGWVYIDLLVGHGEVSIV